MSIENLAFSNCSNLESVSLPSSLISIGDNCFSECSSIKTMNIPDSVQTIGFGSFKNCVKLDTLTLPFVGESQTGNYKFLSYIFGGSNYQSSSSIVASLKKVILGLACRSIAANAFYNCSSLKEVLINSNDIVVNKNAFIGCSSLVSVSCGKCDHRAVRRIVAGISDGIEQVEGYRDPDHLHQIILCLGIISARCHEQQNNRDGHDRRSQQQVRPCFSGRRTCIVYQLADKNISDNNDDRGNDRQHHGKDTELTVGKADHVCVISCKICTEDRVRHHGAQRRDQVADEHFLQFNTAGFDPGLQRRGVEKLLHYFSL